jgi:hypothetical protein
MLRYLSTDERDNIIAELEREVGGEPPMISVAVAQATCFF